MIRYRVFVDYWNLQLSLNAREAKLQQVSHRLAPPLAPAGCRPETASTPEKVVSSN